MTDRQKRILEFIRACHDQGDPPPTLREIMDALSMSSTSVVNYELDALVSAGHIQRDRGSSRGIRLVDTALRQAQDVRKGDQLTELARSTRQLAELVQVHQTQIADLQAEVQRLRRAVEIPSDDNAEWQMLNEVARRGHKAARG